MKGRAMSLAVLNFVVDVQFHRGRKGFFSAKYGNLPVEIYVEFTEFKSRSTIKRNIYQGIAMSHVTYDDDNNSHERWSINPQDVGQVSAELMTFLSELSDQGWKVRQASHKIMGYLEVFRRGEQETSLRIWKQGGFDNNGGYNPLTISTMEEP